MKLQAHPFSLTAGTFATLLLAGNIAPTNAASLQQPLAHVESSDVLAVRHELKRAEIIPTVIDDFLPVLTLSAHWSSKVSATLGNTVKPKKLQHEPTVALHATLNASHPCASDLTYVITLTDPDAPSRDNPEWSEMCHWIASGVSTSHTSEEGCAIGLRNLNNIISYKPPGPPKKTGKHRYVFLVFTPTNGTHAPLNLSPPKDRQHWGTGKERHGVRDWATQNGLTPVAANFIYSQHKKQ